MSPVSSVGQSGLSVKIERRQTAGEASSSEAKATFGWRLGSKSDANPVSGPGQLHDLDL